MKIIIAVFFGFLLTFQPVISSQIGLIQEQARQYRKEGYRLQQLGDSRAALSFYQKAIELDSLYVEAYNDIGVIYEDQGRLEEAKRHYRRALEIDPDFMPAHTNLAFLYERKGNIRKATQHWKKRYLQGKKGDYWHEVARQHLLKLGTYPQIKKELMEKEASHLSRELVQQKSRARQEVIEEAKFYFELGRRAFEEGSYASAEENLNKVLSLNPADRNLNKKAQNMIKEIQNLRIRQKAFINTKDALDFINNSDYFSAAERLKEALSAAFRIAQEDFSQKNK